MSGPTGRDAAEPIAGTRLESVDDIRRALAAARAGGAASGFPEADPFQPVRRPPTARLCILDDRGEDGEWLRLRSDRFTIGRGEGDLVIPHDAMMSLRHAEIVRQAEKGRYRWVLADVQSTNGTFVRAGSAVLRDGQELLLGGGRFRFESPGPGAAEAPDGADARATRGWQALDPAALVPALVELPVDGEGRRFPIVAGDTWIGRDATRCAIVLADDRFVSPRHARLYRDARGDWRLDNAGSLNGVWLRVTRLPVDGSCQFRLGEQRFVLRTS